MKKILFFGVGWLGRSLVHSLSEDKLSISVATTDLGQWVDVDSSLTFVEVGFDSKRLIFADPSFDTGVFEQLVIMLPPSGFDHYDEVIQSICQQIRNVENILFMSSTGVYEDISGIVNENSKIDKSNIVYKAEQVIREFFPQNHSILRLSGLVGEDRHPVKYFLNKDNIPGGESPVNLIHKEDVIRAIKLLLESRVGGETYNLSYPDHPSRAVYYNAFSHKFYDKSLNFEKNGRGKTIDGSKFVTHYPYEYSRPITEIEIIP